MHLSNIKCIKKLYKKWSRLLDIFQGNFLPKKIKTKNALYFGLSLGAWVGEEESFKKGYSKIWSQRYGAISPQHKTPKGFLTYKMSESATFLCTSLDYICF